MEIQPGWTNGVVTLLDPVERGWKLNINIGSKAVLACCEETGEALNKHPEIKGLDNRVLEKPRPWPDLRFQ